MPLELESLVLKSYDRTNKKHLNFKNGLNYDLLFIKFFDKFFLKNIDEIFVSSNKLEINKAYILEENNDVFGLIRIFKKTFNKEITLQYAGAEDYRNKGILKSLIKEFLIINKNSLYKSIKLHINDKNELSKKVFKHIGFKNVESNLYKIDIEKLISYTKPF